MRHETVPSRLGFILITFGFSTAAFVGCEPGNGTGTTANQGGGSSTSESASSSSSGSTSSASSGGGSGGSGGGMAAATCSLEGLAPMQVTVPFPSGNRTFNVRPVIDSFGTSAPPAGTEFDDIYAPGPGECSIATHDRYWVCGSDGRAYRTWHPPTDIDVETGKPCNFGHEHGDDPRTSPLYHWSQGVPFGLTNHLSMLAGKHRHEDHVGHKVTVQNDWEAVIGNPPDNDKPITFAGFHCHWMSKLHQGTHSGDALGHNEHEYFSNLMCDDGPARHPEPGFEQNAGADHHTESSVKVLAVVGPPAAFKACDGLTLTPYPGDGRAPPPGADTNREIKCAIATSGFFYHPLPVEITSETGHPDYPNFDGIDELWKPWLTITSRDNTDVFVASGYYQVRNPARLYNDGSVVPKRDVDEDGQIDDWIPTLEVCLALPNQELCKGLPTFPADVPKTNWWKLPESPFNGTIRVVHPKGVTIQNTSAKAVFCTDYKGVETASDATFDAAGLPSCPKNEIPQLIAPTVNLWAYHATWGPNQVGAGEHVGGSSVNSHQNKSIGCGYGHEWVRFFQGNGVHAPN